MMNVATDAALIPLETSSFSNTGKPSKLHDAAQQFEALMIGEIMKSVRESGSEGSLGGDDEDTANDSAMDMAESQFAKALALGGGIGLSRMIEQNVGAERARLQNVYATRENVSGISHK
jgi:Rod binding domain-containing protein